MKNKKLSKSERKFYKSFVDSTYDWEDNMDKKYAIIFIGMVISLFFGWAYIILYI